MTANAQPVLIGGSWKASTAASFFQASNPRTREKLPPQYPVSPWAEIEDAIVAANQAFVQMRALSPDRVADFLEKYAERIEARAVEICETAFTETALPVSPRLKDIELPRTTGQLRQAAAAAREQSWSLPTIDTANNIRSMLGPIGPVCVFGPNNFPLAFGSISGGDFTAAIASGNPVIAKANSSHPGTTRLFAEEALKAARETGMPEAIVQLVYRTGHEDGKRLVAHPLIGATGYTGSRPAGLALKAAADAAGKLIYLELSSINPVLILPGALEERLSAIVDEYLASVFMGAGQFCTNPGLVLLLAGEKSDKFVNKAKAGFVATPPGTLLGESVEKKLAESVNALQAAGAKLLSSGAPGQEKPFCCPNSLLKISGADFLKNPDNFQQEAFGNAGLIAVAESVDELDGILNSLEGNLTGCIYSDTRGSDDATYARLVPALRQKVGRLINDKMPTGVAVSPAMNHGGPYPSTGHPGFTAVGIPASLRRFAMLQCFDNVRQDRLPPLLRDVSPGGNVWRLVDGEWTREDVPGNTDG